MLNFSKVSFVKAETAVKRHVTTKTGRVVLAKRISKSNNTPGRTGLKPPESFWVWVCFVFTAPVIKPRSFACYPNTGPLSHTHSPTNLLQFITRIKNKNPEILSCHKTRDTVLKSDRSAQAGCAVRLSRKLTTVLLQWQLSEHSKLRPLSTYTANNLISTSKKGNTI